MARRKMKDKYANIVKWILVLVVIAIMALWSVPNALKNMKADPENTDSVEVGKTDQKEAVSKPESSKPAKPTETYNTGEDAELTIWLDSWVWLPISAANGGNETTPDSKFGQRGLTVHIINNESDEEKAEAFKNGEIDAMAATVNRLSLLSGQFYGNTEYVVPYLMDHSSGGDGVVARKGFDSIESLKDAKIAVGKDSVSHVMMLYLLTILFNAS